MIRMILIYIIKKNEQARCTKISAMRKDQGRARLQGSIILNFTLHFCEKLFSSNYAL